MTAREPLEARPGTPLAGTITVPGDKSISHRALIFGGLAVGTTEISGLLEGEDVLGTGRAMVEFGAHVERDPAGVWRVIGRGVGGLAEPEQVLDLGNSGTSARLLAGLAASHPFATFMTGDASLRRRPMGRVVEPLTRMGARFTTRVGGRLPVVIEGAREALPIEYRLPVPSAQVKSAILLAGLNAPGRTILIEPEPTRDHTESMLRHFGASVTVEALADGGRRISLEGHPELVARSVIVPGDPSSAAFPAAAALIVPGSSILVRNVGMNPLRTGFFTTLAEMGAKLEMVDRREAGGEPVADLRVTAGPLTGVDVPARRAPSMIDEYPILAVVASFAGGRTRMRGLAELRVKESDRLAAIARGLAAAGVTVEIEGDDLVVEGSSQPRGGATIAARLDHRIAMSFLVMGLAAGAPIQIDDGATIRTSFPNFVAGMSALGARIAPAAR
jgi:3-phosphoshikimate 1-carboxyvinyltransferase